MKLKAFRIKCFRSVVDSDFQDLSADNITAIVGQNESGKTSILEGIFAFQKGVISEDDLRSNSEKPEVTCIFQLDNFEELEAIFPDPLQLPDTIKSILNELDGCISIRKCWDDIGNLATCITHLENESLLSLFTEPSRQENSPDIPTIDEPTFIQKILDAAPKIVLFEDKGLIPHTIELSSVENKDENTDGYFGASNFLKIADLDFELLKSHQNRLSTDKISAANKSITANFQKYWKQVLGKSFSDKVSIKLEVKNHTGEVPEVSGLPFLTFWIEDRNGNFKPYMRSKGLRWYISFFLTIKAYAKSGQKMILLIDEPGANLHAKAQEDILDVFEKECGSLQIIYATHSPYLFDPKKLYRVLAVERDSDAGITKTYSARELSHVSRDTLFPILTMMGVDISHQNVIEKKDNVLLEEPSAFYYLNSFTKILGKQKKISYLPANGVMNVPMYANLLLGWGIRYSIFLDDDNDGNKIKEQLVDQKILPEEKILFFKGAKGIEDVFSRIDFNKFVLKGSDPVPSTKRNSQHVKEIKISKALIAQNFFIETENERVKREDLQDETIKNFTLLIDELRKSLR